MGSIVAIWLNTLTDKERFFLSQWFNQLAKNEAEIYNNKSQKP